MCLNHPHQLILTSASTYAAALAATRILRLGSKDFRHDVRAISSGHALVITAAAGVALLRTWPISKPPPDPGSTPKDISTHLNDADNPMIFGKSSFGNAITSWEVGYLLYDTCALVLAEHQKAPDRGFAASLHRLCSTDTVFVTHHALLLLSLGYLQRVIFLNQERGLWVITAFFLMYASNPILHLRWLAKQRTGKTDIRLDALLAVTFAVSRFGTIFWLFQRYGAFHNIGPLDAYLRQRLICKTGTGLLTCLNAFWWISLVSGILARSSKRTSHSSL